MGDTKEPCSSESGVFAMFPGGLNLHFQSAAECGRFVWLNDDRVIIALKISNIPITG